MKPSFGPVHSCAKCGEDVQYVTRWGHEILEEMRTGGRHTCIPQVVTAWTFLQCSCGTDVVERDGKRYDRHGALHTHSQVQPAQVVRQVVQAPRKPQPAPSTTGFAATPVPDVFR